MRIRQPGDIVFLCNAGQRHPGEAVCNNLCPVDVQRSTTDSSAFQFRSTHSNSNSLDDKTFFKLGNRTHNHDHRPAGWASRVDILAQTNELDAEMSQLVEHFQERISRGETAMKRASARASDTAEIKALEQRLIDGIKAKDAKQIMSCYSDGVFAYDVVPPLQYVGAAAFQKPWQGFLDMFKGPVKAEVNDLVINSDGKICVPYLFSKGATPNGSSSGTAELVPRSQVVGFATPSWLSYDLRVMYQAYVERGSATSQEDVAQFAELLGHEPRTYGNYAEELARQWVARSAG